MALNTLFLLDIWLINMEISHNHLLNRPAYPSNMVFKKVFKFFSQQVNKLVYLKWIFIKLDGNVDKANAEYNKRRASEAAKIVSHNHIERVHWSRSDSLDAEQFRHKSLRWGTASGQHALQVWLLLSGDWQLKHQCQGGWRTL